MTPAVAENFPALHGTHAFASVSSKVPDTERIHSSAKQVSTAADGTRPQRNRAREMLAGALNTLYITCWTNNTACACVIVPGCTSAAA